LRREPSVENLSAPAVKDGNAQGILSPSKRAALEACEKICAQCSLWPSTIWLLRRPFAEVFLALDTYRQAEEWDNTLPGLEKNQGQAAFRAKKYEFEEIGLQSGTAVGEDGSEQASMGIALGDYNHTGRPSIFVTNFIDESSLLYRNDGWLDLILVNDHVYPQVDSLAFGAGYRQPSTLELNQKDGSFCDASDQAGKALLERRVSRGLAVGDLFNDGDMDVVIEDLDGSPMILRNHGVAGRHGVSFELDGAKSNRLALNARITLVAGGMTQTGEVHSGGSYLSQNDLRVHFGLGSAVKIEKAQIRWPSGKIEELTNLVVDHFYNVVEGKGIVDPAVARPKLAKHP
jgi:hypothetical protein